MSLYRYIIHAVNNPPTKTHLPNPISNPIALFAVIIVGVARGVLLVPVIFAPASASQLVKFAPPRNTPTVCASTKCIPCRMVSASDALVAQKLTVKLNAEALPSQTSVTVVAL